VTRGRKKKRTNDVEIIILEGDRGEKVEEEWREEFLTV
jgi:hypothetical protein